MIATRDYRFMRLCVLAAVLVACHSGAEPVGIVRQSGLASDMGAVLPDGEAARALRVAFPAARGATSVWTPTPAVIQSLEQQLPREFANTLRRVILASYERPTVVEEYYRQYVGFVTATGEHGIFVQGLHRTMIETFEARRLELLKRSDRVAITDWRRHYIGVSDGGILRFQALYRVERASFDSLWFNGRLEGPIELRPQ